jgi:hypothetical protein
MKKALIVAVALVVVLAAAITVVLLTGAEAGSEVGEQSANSAAPANNTTAQTPIEDATTTPSPAEFFTLDITTLGDAEPFTVRTLWIDSLFTLTDPRGSAMFESAAGRIRGRGRTSWSNQYLREKRPLRVRFDGSSSERLRHMAGSEHAARNWVLRSMHQDKSLMRDYSAFYLGELLPGIYWSPFAAFVHLYVNDEYMGVYMLTDERDVGPGRAQLTADPDPAVSEYMIESDWRLYRNDAIEGQDYVRVNTHPDGPREGDHSPSSARAGALRRDYLYEIRVPDDDILTPAHFDYIRSLFTEAGLALRAGNMADIERLVDVDSLIDFYLVQELFQNVDAGFSSMFYQVKGQGEDRRIVLGPLWDFDVAAGNADWLSNQTPYGLYVSTRWYWGEALHQTPQLRERMIQRWNDYFVPATHQMLAHIHQVGTRYEAAFERNFERFPIMGVYVWPNPPHVVEIDTFMGQVDYLIDFLTRRMHYLDEYFNS